MKTQSFKGREFQVVQGSTHPMYSYHTFELEEHDLRNKYWNIQDGDVVIDVGASYGSYALTAAVMGATVYAFEPESSVFVDLVRNITLNGWDNKVFAYCLALDDKDGVIDMKEYAPHWAPQTITSTFTATTLDNAASKLTKLDWIKIDVEGMEENVIKGGMKTINTYKPKLLIECHDFMKAGISTRVKELLPNYKFEDIERDPCITLMGVHQ